MTESPFARVNQEAPIMAVLKSCYPEIRGKNKDYCSPFRADSDPSFHVYDGVGSDGRPENHCYDFGTLTRYTPIDITRLRYGLTIKEAAERLNQEYQCGAVFTTRKPDKRTVEKARKRHQAIAAMFTDENARRLRDAGKEKEADAIDRTAELWELFAFEDEAPDVSVETMERRAVDIFGANAVHDELVDAGLESVSDVKMLMRRASEFNKIPVRFLWFPFLPVCEYSLMAAPGGTGKGMAAGLIAACVSKGVPLPEEQECPAPLRAFDPHEPHDVLFISSEDTGDAISARLEISGADLERVTVIGKNDVPKLGLNLADPSGLMRLQEMITENGAALTILDPIQAFLGDTDINKMANVRGIMAGISRAAEYTNSAILLIGHTRKGNDGDLNDSVTGSVDIVNAARSVFCITKDFEDPNPQSDNRLIVHTKINGARLAKSLRFRIETGAIQREGATVEVGGGRFAEGDKLHSEVSREVIETARMMKMTVRRYLEVRDTELSDYAELVEALRLEAERMRRDRDTEWRQHCEKIPGMKNPYKVTVSKIAPKLAFEGILIEYRDQVKVENVNRAGVVLKVK